MRSFASPVISPSLFQPFVSWATALIRERLQSQFALLQPADSEAAIRQMIAACPDALFIVQPNAGVVTLELVNNLRDETP